MSLGVGLILLCPFFRITKQNSIREMARWVKALSTKLSKAVVILTYLLSGNGDSSELSRLSFTCYDVIKSSQT